MSDKKDIYSAVSQVVKDLNKDEFRSLLASFDYFSFKFPELIARFPNDFEKFKGHGHTWGAFLREIRFWNEVGVDKMNRRLLQLTLRYIPKGEKFFKIENETGSFTLPTRLDRLNKISLLAKELVYDIFPRIENHLNFRAEIKSISTRTIRGTINWSTTIVESINRGEKYPTIFSCNVNETNFDTPENLLTLACLMKLQSDIDYLIYSRGSKDLELNFKEANLLKNLKIQLDKIVLQNHLQGFIPKIKELVHYSLSSKPIQSMEEKTKQRIRQGIVKQPAYGDLIDWLERYQSYYIKGIREEFTNYPIEHEKTIDIIYELWVIFELVSYLIEKKGIIFISSLTRDGDKFAGFKLKLGQNTLYLNYQGKHSGWTGYESEPDFTIQLEGSDEIPIVMDPKNYSSTDPGGAIHKMLGYLLNLSKYNARVGILFFSQPVMGLRQETLSPLPYQKSTRTDGGKEILFYTMFVNPNNIEYLETSFEQVFEQLKLLVKNYNPNLN